MIKIMTKITNPSSKSNIKVLKEIADAVQEY